MRGGVHTHARSQHCTAFDASQPAVYFCLDEVQVFWSYEEEFSHEKCPTPQRAMKQKNTRRKRQKGKKGTGAKETE